MIRRWISTGLVVVFLALPLSAAEKGSVARAIGADAASAKLSPSLRDRLAKSAGPIDVIVQLWGQEVTNPRLSPARFDREREAFFEEADARIEEVLAAVPGIAVNHIYRASAGFSARVSPGQLDALTAQPAVRIIVPQTSASKSRLEGNGLMRVAAVHGNGVRGTGVSVGVIDDGVDYSHGELGAGGFPNSVVVGGYDFEYKVAEPSPTSGDSHGTAVAGIIAGQGDPQTGASGVAPDAKIVGLRVGGESLPMENILAALNWSIEHQNQVFPPIRIVNMSLGFDNLGYFIDYCDGNPEMAPFKEAIDRVVAAGILPVAATGNEAQSGTSLPSCLSKVVSVGAVYDGALGGLSFSACSDNSTAADQVTCYSNSAGFIDVLAPSHNARTAKAGGGYDEEFGGTSAAAPYASGVLALLMSSHPNRPLEQYRSILKSSGKPVLDALSGITTPRVDALAAWQAMQGSTGGAKPYGYFLLAAARFQGTNNTFYKSDLRVANLGTGTASVDAFLLDGSGDNSTKPPGASFVVGANQVSAFNDAVSSMLGLASGGGAVYFASDQPLVITSDLYTTNNVCPQIGGTFGQFIPALGFADAGTRQRLFHVISDGNYRTNFGMINASSAPNAVTARILESNGSLKGQKTYNLGPFGWLQINRVFNDVNASPSSNATIEIVATQPVLTYVSIVDEKTGDPFLLWGVNQ